MTVLVTGGAGFLGSHITSLLVARGERPRVLVLPDEELRMVAESDVDICRGDVTEPSVVENAVRGVERVINCAARTGPWGRQSEYSATNVEALESLIGAAMAANVERVVHVSSITVHGNDVHGYADETAPFKDEPNPYSRSKIAGERLIMRLVEDSGARVTMVRPGWIYGPGDKASFGRLVERVERNRMLMVGPGSNHLPLIYVSDAAEGAVRASESGEDGKAYLLVNDEAVSQREFLAAIASELGVGTPEKRIPYRVALFVGASAEYAARLAKSSNPPPVMRYGLQLLGGENRFIISRARRELGFSPQIGYVEGVKMGVDWYRSDIHTRATQQA